MKTLHMMLLAAAAAIPGTAALVVPAAAQVAGIAVANPEGAIARSKAWTAAQQQIQTQYKTQLDQAEARRQAIQTELQPMYTAFDKARQAPGATEASLRPQVQAIQTKENAANQELGRLTAPVQRAQAYALEQVQNQLAAAVTAATQRKNVQLLLRPDAALMAQPATDITADITAELDRLVPSVNINPPANWQPGQQQQAAAPAAPAATTPARPATNQGR